MKANFRRTFIVCTTTNSPARPLHTKRGSGLCTERLKDTACISIKVHGMKSSELRHNHRYDDALTVTSKYGWYTEHAVRNTHKLLRNWEMVKQFDTAVVISSGNCSPRVIDVSSVDISFVSIARPYSSNTVT